MATDDVEKRSESGTSVKSIIKKRESGNSIFSRSSTKLSLFFHRRLSNLSVAPQAVSNEVFNEADEMQRESMTRQLAFGKNMENVEVKSPMLSNGLLAKAIAVIIIFGFIAVLTYIRSKEVEIELTLCEHYWQDFDESVARKTSKIPNATAPSAAQRGNASANELGRDSFLGRVPNIFLFNQMVPLKNSTSEQRKPSRPCPNGKTRQ